MSKLKVKRPRPAPEAKPAQITKPASVSARHLDPGARIKSDTIVYRVWKEWWMAKERGDYEFIYGLTAPGSAARAEFGPAADFPTVCQRKLRRVLGVEQGDLRRIRFHSDDEAYLIHAIGLRARERRDYDAERWCLLRSERGWRVHQVDRITVTKDRQPEVLTMADFPAFAAAPVTAPASASASASGPAGPDAEA
ncbi:MAG: hypothetical protein H6698_01295 [Myxococcales bacterium]|nr:hypothetical protein [Myxococcales bacterium]MCB9532945.1 hypothetical protein [Myxococcales bacterium]